MGGSDYSGDSGDDSGDSGDNLFNWRQSIDNLFKMRKSKEELEDSSFSGFFRRLGRQFQTLRPLEKNRKRTRERWD